MHRFARYLLYVVKVALPLMLLAGVLGALVIEIVPFSFLTDVDPGVLVLLASAVLATVLPVPIAFDVIIVMALLANGIDTGLAMVLLYGLGIYSVYPAIVIARYISVRLSLGLAVAVVLVASALGLAAQTYFERKAENEQQVIAQGLARSGQTAYANAIQVCDRLPAQLQLRCFAQHIEQFDDVVSYASMCETRPAALDQGTCDTIVNESLARRRALESSTTAPCSALPTAASRSQCIYSAVSHYALSDHDIRRCDDLPNSSMVGACRTQYLNASLLFNPDESVCRDLEDERLADCRINAAIYRFADTMHFAGCNELDSDDAREHCRYVIASSMIGRRNDPSGCSELGAPALAQRCRSLVTAWQALRDTAPDLCKELGAADLRDLCLLRVADKEIQMVLTQHTLMATVGGLVPIGSAETRVDTPSAPAVEAPRPGWNTILARDDVEIAFTPYQDTVTIGSMPFRKVAARELGITRSWDFRLTDFFEPFIIGKGIASGDFNNDLWPDLALATESGVLLYQNVGGRFQLVSVDQGELQNKNLFLVAFVDVDNDGQQDLFASAYGGQNYLLINAGGGFDQAEVVTLEGDHRLTLSAGFADLDQNGELDIVLGNWSSGVEKLFAPEASGNQILFRDGESYRAEKLDEIRGETNSVLLADINGDQLTDLLIGNDRIVPDVYYLGLGQGEFEPISVGSEIVPVTSMFTMSLDTADFNNDLEPDLFSTDMTFARSTREDYCSAIQDAEAGSRCTEIIDAYQNFRDGSATKCTERIDPLEQQECFVSFSVKAAKALKDPQYCQNLPDKDAAIYSLCQYLASPVPAEEPIDQGSFIRQSQTNTLLMGAGGRFVERGVELGVESSFWSWNAKAADLDNDSWQDIYVGNGFHFGDSFYEVQENILFHNIEGERFEQVQSRWGVDDSINTPSYTYLDLDLDGDLDIVATGVLAPPRVFLNQHTGRNSITFLLSDERGNSSAIGAKITIRYGGQAEIQQRKENKLSGGFMSFDNPAIHFGLGQYTAVDEVAVQWPDGETTVYQTSLPASGFYRIRRLSSSRSAEAPADH